MEQKLTLAFVLLPHSLLPIQSLLEASLIDECSLMQQCVLTCLLSPRMFMLSFANNIFLIVII